jgi:hypothetical protein
MGSRRFLLIVRLSSMQRKVNRGHTVSIIIVIIIIQPSLDLEHVIDIDAHARSWLALDADRWGSAVCRGSRWRMWSERALREGRGDPCGAPVRLDS